MPRTDDNREVGYGSTTPVIVSAARSGTPLMARLHRPGSLAEAVAILAVDPEARPLAGGATLMALINANLAQPDTMVALDRIPELRGIDPEPDGGVRIGAMTLHRETAADSRLNGQLAMLREAAGTIANPVVRNMGTIGGSLAFADPAADYVPALTALDATVEVAGSAGARRIPVVDFFVDWYTSALEPGEIVVAVHVPALPSGRGLYRKIARTSSDYAIASCAVGVDAVGRVRAAVGACGPVPIRDAAAEEALADRSGDPRAVRVFAERLAALADPVDDVRGSAGYRRTLIPRIVASTIREAQPPSNLVR